MPMVFMYVMARDEALNSTGSVTSWNTTTTA